MTKVRLVFEEFEKACGQRVNASKIKYDIQNSNAVFLILSENVQLIPHTRDWVAWEAGVSSNKDIWVFEPLSIHQISVVIPHLRHYMLFQPHENYFPYVRCVIESYDDSHVLPTVLTTTALGAFFGKLGKNPMRGATEGFRVGLEISDASRSRPQGLEIRCANSNCGSCYHVHLPQGVLRFRCPVCNMGLSLSQSSGQDVRKRRLRHRVVARKRVRSST